MCICVGLWGWRKPTDKWNEAHGGREVRSRNEALEEEGGRSMHFDILLKMNGEPMACPRTIMCSSMHEW